MEKSRRKKISPHHEGSNDILNESEKNCITKLQRPDCVHYLILRSLFMCAFS